MNNDSRVLMSVPQYPPDLYEYYRPSFPMELYNFIFSLVPNFNCSVDCGTGTGKALDQLIPVFRKVVAIDISLDMLKLGRQKSRTNFVNAKAECMPIESNSIALIFAGQAFHWFDTLLFAAEADRVLVREGIIAAACYGRPRISPEVDHIVHHLFNEILGKYWETGAWHISSGYKDLNFPYRQIEAPQLEIVENWNIERFLGFLSSWSGVLAFRKANGKDPLDLIEADLRKAWGDAEKARKVAWPVFEKIGKKH